MSNIKLLKVPENPHTVNKMLDRAFALNLTNVIILSEGEDGVLILQSGMPSDRVNWILDRAKFGLHRADE